jgi:5-methylcytosine-specific restriction protein A
MRFRTGETYHRQNEIHAQYDGQRYGGISTPTEYPVVFLFTGEAGSEYGYRDEFRPDGTYWYTGEGQEGDMEMNRGNRAVRDHEADGKTLHLFEAIGEGLVRYVGEATYLDHHIEERSDQNGDLRRAIVFELAVETVRKSGGESEIQEGTSDYSTRQSGSGRYWSTSKEKLKSVVLNRASSSSSVTERKKRLRKRSKAIKVYARRRAEGECEGCGEEAPFETAKGRPFLEVHHIHRLSDGGPDHPQHVVALCPNCHRQVHHGDNGDEYNQRLARKVKHIEEGGI